MKKTQTQQQMLRAARQALNITTEELAVQVGAKLKTLRSWLLPDDSKSHRQMSNSARLLLDRIMAEHRQKKK